MATPYSGNNRLLVAYGLTQALENIPPQPIVAKRSPTTSDSAQLGTVWVQPTNTSGTAVNTAWVLTSIISNSANWEAIGGSGGAGVFASLLVNPGPVTTQGTGAVSISGDAVATTVGIGNGAGVKTVTLGSTNSTSATTVQAGSGAINLTTAATGTINIGAATMTGTIQLGQSTAGQTVSIANAINTGASTINIASAAAGAATTVNILTGVSTAGAQAVNIATGAAASTTTIGNVTGASALVLNAGTGNIVASTAAIGIITLGSAAMTGNINLGISTAGQVITIGNAANTGAQAVNIASGVATANSTVTILGGASTAGTPTFNVLNNATATTGAVNIATAAAAHVVTIGHGTTGNITNLASAITALPGPVYIYTGAGVPSNGLALHVGDLYINTTAASSSTRMYIATAANTWTNVTCAA